MDFSKNLFLDFSKWTYGHTAVIFKIIINVIVILKQSFKTKGQF